VLTLLGHIGVVIISIPVAIGTVDTGGDLPVMTPGECKNRPVA
jgi:hypothetical protein